MSDMSVASAQTLTPEFASHSIFRPYPRPQTPRQWFYLLFLQGFGAGIIDFGANFAIAYGMYQGQADVRMWVFSKNTIAGDLGVTPIIQTAVSMLISSTLVHTDLHHHAIQPLPFVYPHVEHLPDPRELFDRVFKRKNKTAADEKMEMERAKHNNRYGKRGFHYYFWMLVRFAFEGTEMNMIVAKCGPRTWPLRVLWTAAQGALLGIIFGFPLWCLAIVILGPIYGTGNIGGKWAPQAIKGVYGCIVGWVTNPVIATLALGSQADHHIVVVPVDVEADIGQSPEMATENITTIVEEGEDGHADLSVPPSPFLTPFRANTTGNITGRPRSNTSRSTAAISIQGPRVRADSVHSLRPPLTANVSYIGSALPATLSPGLSAAASQTPGARPRRLTVSSILSTTATTPTGTVSPATGPQYAYMLGGTGGRAKRSRSNTTATLPDSAILGLGRPGAAPAGHRVPSSPAVSHAGLPPPKPSFVRPNRANSDFAGGVSHAEKVASGCEEPPQPRYEPGQDVFGSTVPMLRVQRPSLDHRTGGAASADSSADSSPTQPQRRTSCEGPLGERRE